MHAKATMIHSAKNKEAGGLEFTATYKARIDKLKSNAAANFISPTVPNGAQQRPRATDVACKLEGLAGSAGCAG